MTPPKADVCFVVEGSYPYITGGVASWVHQLVTSLPEITFALITLLPDEHSARVDKYEVPKNVIARKDVFLFGEAVDPGTRKEASGKLVKAIRDLHDAPVESRCPFIRSADALLRAGGQTAATLQTARTSWHLMRDFYHKRQRTVSFLDYFWTWRAIHGPMFRLMDVELLPADVYHPVSTGYAGFLASLAKFRLDAGVLLTEHGLYTREREIEIANAAWIYEEPVEGTFFAPHELFFKGWWRNQYRFLGQLTYETSDVIATLHVRNRDLQIQAGAAPEKMHVVPNGIYPEHFAAGRVARDWSERPFRVGLIGRVVPIKDIKTFLRAIQAASAVAPIEAFILGPYDEDPAYYQECLDLVELLRIGHVVTFTGRVNLKEWMGKIDLNVLTSVSESQPLVILEAGAAGVPTIATDVGACREMLEGKVGDDALLGPSGIITPVASPGATAQAILDLARDPQRFQEMADAGLKRIERFYHQDAVFAYYRQTYAQLAKQARAARGEAPAGGR